MSIKGMPCEKSTAVNKCGECYFKWCPIYQNILEDKIMNKVLKSCPFCGKKAEIYIKVGNSEDSDWLGPLKKDAQNVVYSKAVVMCHKCSAGTKPYNTIEEAIDKWNTRIK